MKKELCIVHIGMPKTGSSTLQETFFNHIEDERVSYADLREPNQSGRFCGLFLNKTEGYHYFSNRSWSTERVKKFITNTRKMLIQDFEQSTSPIKLISGEDLFHLRENEIEKMKAFLYQYFEKVLIVGYVRPVKSLLESAFQQLVKNHYLGHFEFGKIYHNYTNFQRYDDIFGKENVMLLEFNPDRFPDGDIVLDFCNHVGIEPMKSQQKVVNESLSLEAVSILFTYHFHKNSKTDFGDKVHPLNLRLVELIRPIGHSKCRFANKLIDSIIDTYKEDYDWVLNRMGADFHKIQNPADDIGIESKQELMLVSVDYIPNLVSLLDPKYIDFDLNQSPQTVFRLVDKLMLQLSKAN